MSSTISLIAVALAGRELERQHLRRRLRGCGRRRRGRCGLRVHARSRGAARRDRAGTGRTLRRSGAAAPAVRNQFNSATSASLGGKCAASNARRRGSSASRSRTVARQRIRRSARAVRRATCRTSLRCMFGVTAAGLLVERDDAAGVQAGGVVRHEFVFGVQEVQARRVQLDVAEHRPRPGAASGCPAGNAGSSSCSGSPRSRRRRRRGRS